MSAAVRPRVGCLGLGWIGRHRLQALAASGHVDVVAIADVDPRSLDAAALVVPSALHVSTLEALLALRLDGVVIATPSAQHASQARQALAAGAAVFCQKPLGRDAAEVRSVVDAALTADRLLRVDLSYRYTAATRQLRERLDAGDIGPVHAVDLEFHNGYGPDKPWFYDVRQSGGGCVMDLGVHLVDLALWLLGFPEVAAVDAALYAGGHRLPRPPAEVEDLCLATVGLAGGATLRLACSWRMAIGGDARIVVRLHGRDGGLALENVGGSFYDFRAVQYRGTDQTVVAEPPDDWSGRAIVDWGEGLARGARADESGQDSVRVASVLDAIYGRAAGADRPACVVGG